MKLNFWQWLGVVILILATPIWVYKKINERKAERMGTPQMTFPADGGEADPTTGPTTEPTTTPVTAPQ